MSDRKYRQRGYQDSPRERRPAQSGPGCAPAAKASGRSHRDARRQGRAQGARRARAQRARLPRGDAVLAVRQRVHRTRLPPTRGASAAAPTSVHAPSASRSTPARRFECAQTSPRGSLRRMRETRASCFRRASRSSAKRTRRRSLRPQAARARRSMTSSNRW